MCNSKVSFKETDIHIWLIACWSMSVYAKAELYWWIQLKTRLTKQQIADVVKRLISVFSQSPSQRAEKEKKNNFCLDRVIAFSAGAVLTWASAPLVMWPWPAEKQTVVRSPSEHPRQQTYDKWRVAWTGKIVSEKIKGQKILGKETNQPIMFQVGCVKFVAFVQYLRSQNVRVCVFVSE